MGEKIAVFLLSLSSWCQVPEVGLQFVIVVFPDHIHLHVFRSVIEI